MHNFEIKKKIKHDCFCVCCINLNYEWNSLLKKKKKIFFILLKHIKNRSDFSVIKNHFFYQSKQVWIFVIKNNFFKYYKIDLVFWQIKINFFYQSKQIWFFSKEETSFINRFVWFNFGVTCSTYHSWHV